MPYEAELKRCPRNGNCGYYQDDYGCMRTNEDDELECELDPNFKIYPQEKEEV